MLSKLVSDKCITFFSKAILLRRVFTVVYAIPVFQSTSSLIPDSWAAALLKMGCHFHWFKCKVWELRQATTQFQLQLLWRGDYVTCWGVIGDEEHFLITYCSSIDISHRNRFFKHCTVFLRFEYTSSKDKFLFVMSSKGPKLLSLLAVIAKQSCLFQGFLHSNSVLDCLHCLYLLTNGPSWHLCM